MTSIRFAASIAAACAAAAGTAHAGGFASSRFGGEHGNPADDHPTAVYFNPAGLALGHGTRLYAEGLFVLRLATYDRPESAIDNIVEPGDSATGTPREAVGANAGKASLTNFLVSPFLGAASDFGIEGFGAGVGVYVPFGGQATWDQNQDFENDATYPGAVDGVQRWSTIDGSLRALYISGGAGYSIGALSLGASLNVVRSSIDTVRARVATGTDDLVSGSGNVVEGRALVQTSSVNLSVGAGAIYEALPRQLWIGASYQSQPGFGEYSQSGTLTQKFGTGASNETDIDLVQSLPDVIRAGVRWRPGPALELRLSGDYTRWSVFDKQCLVDGTDPDAHCSLEADGSAAADAVGVIVNVPRGWNDTYGARAGASYWLNPDFEVGGSVAYDSNAVPDDVIDPALMDMDKVIVSGEARYDVLPGQLRLALGYTHVIYFSRDVGAQMETAGASQVPDFSGTYSQTLGFLSLGVEGFLP